MLGCQDFCGYYDWTFRHVADRHGQAAVEALWREAIGGESQLHYLRAALAEGLRGLYHTWVKTGEDEHCDWTFTLDESRNVLRWDMRRCPSKGFLLENDLNACADYCDHCMGWMVPLLQRAGIEVLEHEHNHCGQCWGVMSVRGRPYEPLKVPRDVRDDPNWRHGYLERWEQGRKVAPPDRARQIPDPDSADALARALISMNGVIVSGADFADAHERAGAVVIDAPPIDLPRIARRYLDLPVSQRPVLLYSYPPVLPPVDFVGQGLPRPLPALPLLIREGLYRHHPGAAGPDTETLIQMLRAAVRKVTGGSDCLR